MAECLIDNIVLIPFLFVAYLLMELIERRSGVFVRLSRWIRGGGVIGPIVGAAAGMVPQCGLAAATASMYAGGVVSAGTLIAVFLSTSDELVPVLASRRMSCVTISSILLVKFISAICAGVIVCLASRIWNKNKCIQDGAIRIEDMCISARCGCGKHNGIWMPALVHTARMFVFIFMVSLIAGWIIDHAGGESALRACALNRPIAGEVIGGLVGLSPNCAVSVMCAELYSEGAMSSGALLASSLTGSGIGIMVLFKTNRGIVGNMCILMSVYFFGVIFGIIGGFFIS